MSASEPKSSHTVSQEILVDITGGSSTSSTSTKLAESQSFKQRAGQSTSSNAQEDATASYKSSESNENDKPLLMNDISRMMETMHSKNLMLKKLVRMQQGRLELLKCENEELRKDVKRKDAQLRNAEVTIHGLQTEIQHEAAMHVKREKRAVVEHSKSPGKTEIDRNKTASVSTNTAVQRSESCPSDLNRCMRFSPRGMMKRLSQNGHKATSRKQNPLKVMALTLCGALFVTTLTNMLHKKQSQS